MLIFIQDLPEDTQLYIKSVWCQRCLNREKCKHLCLIEPQSFELDKTKRLPEWLI